MDERQATPDSKANRLPGALPAAGDDQEVYAPPPPPSPGTLWPAAPAPAEPSAAPVSASPGAVSGRVKMPTAKPPQPDHAYGLGDAKAANFDVHGVADRETADTDSAPAGSGSVKPGSSGSARGGVAAVPVSPTPALMPERIDSSSRKLAPQPSSGAARAAVPGAVHPDSADAVSAASWPSGPARVYGNKQVDQGDELGNARIVRPTGFAAVPASAAPSSPAVSPPVRATLPGAQVSTGGTIFGSRVSPIGAAGSEPAETTPSGPRHRDPARALGNAGPEPGKLERSEPTPDEPTPTPGRPDPHKPEPTTPEPGTPQPVRPPNPFPAPPSPGPFPSPAPDPSPTPPGPVPPGPGPSPVPPGPGPFPVPPGPGPDPVPPGPGPDPVPPGPGPSPVPGPPAPIFPPPPTMWATRADSEWPQTTGTPSPGTVRSASSGLPAYTMPPVSGARTPTTSFGVGETGTSGSPFGVTSTASAVGPMPGRPVEEDPNATMAVPQQRHNPGGTVYGIGGREAIDMTVPVSFTNPSVENSGSLTGHILAQGWRDEIVDRRRGNLKVAVAMLVVLGLMVTVSLVFLLTAGSAFTDMISGMFD